MVTMDSTMPVQNASWLDEMYNIAFRLTGQHHKASILVQESLNGVGADNYSQIMLRNLCVTFLNMEEGNKGSFPKTLTSKKSGSEKVQEALLKLPAPERLVIVLREVAGFQPARVADLTGLEKEQVAKMLASGRSSLVSMLKTGEVN